jgi:hypothetical protein
VTASLVELAGSVTGTETVPAEQPTVRGRPERAGEELREQLVASVTDAPRVTDPPADPTVGGVAANPVMTGAEGSETVTVVVAFTLLEPLAERLKV